jgi:hypothetical protein
MGGPATDECIISPDEAQLISHQLFVGAAIRADVTMGNNIPVSMMVPGRASRPNGEFMSSNRVRAIPQRR